MANGRGSRTGSRGAAGAAGAGVETSARSVDEAIAQALQQLRLTRDDVDVEVLHPGSPGRLLGFGAEPARVRVVPRAGGRPGAEAAEDGDEAEEDAADDQTEALGLGAPAPRTAGGRRPSRAESTDDEEGDGEAIPENLEGEAELARLMLAELLNRMGIDDATVEVTGTDPMMLEVAGNDLADLIGRRGETLRSIQFILNLMLNKQLRRRIRVNVDVDGYRSRREELLRSMAERFAHRVRSTREPMQLETMPPNERRVIHMALADDPDVETESIGEGESRRVVIRPKR